ncbi:MAG: radical SAM family heme chaperone HemW [Oscillospiraceae bacterium]|nr:radical SAM family heme chaperone HemW [Oscillospiraceae bacterium]
MKKLGIYLHTPFCARKCAYCDFYSLSGNNELYEKYTAALCERVAFYGVRLSRPADTLYLGGGTPSLLGGERIGRIVSTAKQYFDLQNAEITLEANPADNLGCTLKIAALSGVNRLSLGVQSAIQSELKSLSRRHNNSDVIRTVSEARAAGIENISCDLMIGIPGQTVSSLCESLDFILSLNPEHISVYILKIEPETPFGRTKSELLNLPNDDTTADLYLKTCEVLNMKGFIHYEISNFAKEGYSSKHNLKYWNCEEYLGLGPASHSFLGGKRTYYERSIDEFFNGDNPLFESEGGTSEEYIMLRLRLLDGLDFCDYKSVFGEEFTNEKISIAKKYEKMGLMTVTQSGISLTERGFLVSNSIISALM